MFNVCLSFPNLFQGSSFYLPEVWIEVDNVVAGEVTTAVHTAHHAASSLDYLPADPHIDSMLMVAKTSESPSAVKMSHKPMKDPKLEIANEE